MGGGDTFPCAADVQEVIAAGQQYEAEKKFSEAAKKYREAAELLLKISKSKTLSSDERFALEIQSSELTRRSQDLEDRVNPDIVHAEYVQQESNLNQNQPYIAMPQSQGQTSSSTPPNAPYSSSTPPTTDEEELSQTNETIGAAAVGAVSGLGLGSLIGMPVFGMIAGAATGGVATTLDNEYGVRARKVGRYGANTIDEAKRLNRKHNISGNAKVAAESAVYKAKEINEKHDITGKIQRTTQQTIKKAQEINEKHDVTGKAAKAAQTTLKAASDLNTKYKITDKVAGAVESGLKAISKSLGSENSQRGNPPPPPPR